MIPTHIDHINTSLNFNHHGQSIITHIWYKLLNSSTIGMLFKSSELAKKGECTTRTVYNFLKEREAAGEIKVENKGCNGLLITMLKKGWELSKSFKIPFLAYFRDKGLIPYINTTNTFPSGVDPNTPQDRIDKMCAKEGLNQAQTRAVKDKVKQVNNIKSLGGIVKHFINQVKEGILMALQSGNDMQARRNALDKLRAKADLDAKVDLELKGIVEPKPNGALMTTQEFDAIREYHSLHATHSVILYNKLCLEAGYAKIT